MRRVLALFALLALLPVPLFADEPLVEVTFDENKAVPGQSLVLRITVLVPTWLPKPVVFPSFEAPNLQVRLPEGSTSPTSRTIEGETWSGVSRRYFITPMVPGNISIPGQELLVTWAQPGQPDPTETRVALEPVVIEGVIPEGAESLDPFLAANTLTLGRDMPQIEGPLKAGESLTLTVTAEIEGVSAMMLPALVPEIALQGVSVYRDEAVVADRDDRGVLSGTRSERITLLAESGGGAEVPEISLGWYNLETGTVETASLEGFSIEIDAPVGARVRNLDPRGVVYAALTVLLGVGACWLLWRFLAPRVRTLLAERRSRIEASEPWAYAQVRDAAKARDMGLLMTALDLWAARSASDPRDIEPLHSALSSLGAARYGHAKTQESALWDDVNSALAPTRARVQKAPSGGSGLPPLNPTVGNLT